MLAIPLQGNSCPRVSGGDPMYYHAELAIQ